MVSIFYDGTKRHRYVKGGMGFSTPPRELFVFQSADPLQIGKSVRMPSKIDVVPFHIVRFQIQAEKGFERFMLFIGKIDLAFSLQKLHDKGIMFKTKSE